MALHWYATLFIILGVLVAIGILLQPTLNHLMRKRRRHLTHDCAFCRISRLRLRIYICILEIYQWGPRAFLKRRVKHDSDEGLPFYNNIYRQPYQPEDPPLTPHTPYRPRQRQDLTKDRHKGPGLQFFTLPAEIRHEIYKALAHTVISLKCAPTRYSRPSSKFKKATALLRTCRQTRHEYFPIFFRSILFMADAEFPFYKKMYFPARCVLRKLLISTKPRPAFGPAEDLKKMLLDVVFMRSLQELHIVSDAWSVLLHAHDIRDLLSVDKVTQLPDLRFARVTVTCKGSWRGHCREFLEWVLLKANRAWPRGVKLENYTDHLPDGQTEIQHIVIRTEPYDSRMDYRAIAAGSVRVDEPFY